MQKFKQLLKELFLTKQGWFSWALANVITSQVWFMPLFFGFILNNQSLYALSGAIWVFIMLPATPLWVVNVVLAVWLRKTIFTK
jgi:hypothetical protein